ncbi:MAG: HWE histidine kinase domain-containing protein [Litorimonas sp.]
METTTQVGATYETPDLTTCDREPIHIPGRVQSFGALIALTPDWLIARASENVSDMLGLTDNDHLGREISELFCDEAVHRLRGRLQMLGHQDAVERLFGVDLRGNGARFDVALHLSGQAIVVEIEPSGEAIDNDYVGYVRPMIDRIRKASTVDELCQVASRQVKALVGFDRVMVYQFAEDGSGHVIAETREPHMESFAKLRYPASDIPKQARALYKRSLLRIISDVSDTGQEIHPVLDSKGQPLDLSLSSTRAVSPIHLEYLSNMGVAASMSISIIVRGELWGLIACHHESPRVLPYEVRSAAELFAQLFAFVLAETEADQTRQDDLQGRVLHDRIMAELADGGSVADNFDSFARTIGSVMPYSGIVSWTDGQFQQRGKTPTREQFLALARFLNTTAVSEVYATDRLSSVFPAAEDYTDIASGILALPVSRKPRDYIVLFREEYVREVDWAGNPDKPVEVGPNGVRLTPRKSFEAWTQTVHGRSRPWTTQELHAAEALRVTLLEVVLRMTDNAVRERAKSQEHQELLIAELNHRVRNILNLIRGLINQSSDASSVAEFTQVIGGRIHALARAHDQITDENWAPASAYELIETEVTAYLEGKADRVAVSGTDAMLHPNAYTTLALVIHEMVTNAVKYGALSNDHGRIEIEMSQSDGGALVIHWRESGGPPVTAPTRRGFGTTITERSIEYELNGQSEIQFEVTGVKARFFLPPDAVSAFTTIGDAKRPSAPADDTKTVGLSGNVLVVEDNMVIALDAEDLLLDLGAAHVVTAASTASALDHVDRTVFEFALLDVNLGAETSERVADRLVELGVPFAFATGYGDRTSLSDKFQGRAFLRKPYNRETIAAAIEASRG